MQTSTLRPGLLVSLNTTVAGNVSYARQEIEPEHMLDNGMSKAARWQTSKLITDAAEDERARMVRSKARAVITAVCARSAFGLLCPETKASELESAIREARRLTDEFNETATLSRVGVYVITGRVAPDDVEAVRAINSEIRELLATMANGIETLDVERVRDAANRARNLEDMLTDQAKERVREAIATARSAARKIAKAGESAAVEIDRSAIRRVQEARSAFLDIDEAQEVAMPQAAEQELDLTPETTPLKPIAARLAAWDDVDIT